MAFIKTALAEAKESEHVPEGQYDLRVAKSERKEFKGGREGYTLTVVVEDSDFPNAAPIFHNLLMVKEDDKDTTRNMMVLGQRRFFECFGIAYEDDGFDDDDLEGATGRCQVTVKNRQKDDGSGKFVDVPGEFVNELKLPRLVSGEDQEEAPKKGPSSKRRK